MFDDVDKKAEVTLNRHLNCALVEYGWLWKRKHEKLRAVTVVMK